MTESVQPAPRLATLSHLAELFEARYGLRADEAARARLQGAVAERMRDLGIRETAAYRDDVDSQPEERQRLLDLFLVGETSFFRTPAYFEALRQQVLPELHDRLPSGAPLRVWSAGCATGEEAYSLAMVCAEQLHGRREFEVIATDLSHSALERARRGRYGPRAVAKVPRELGLRYLEPSGRDFVVTPAIRDRVQWGYLNLAEAPLHPGLRNNLQVIFCQNVLIYFSPAALQATLSNLGASLADEGYLFLGYSERLPTPWAGFEFVWLAGAGAWRKTGVGSQVPEHRTPNADHPTPETRHLAPEPRPPRSALGTQHSLETLATARTAVEAGRAAEAIALLEPQLGSKQGEGHLLMARACADLGRTGEALEHARRAVELAPLSDEAHALSGTLLASQGQPDEAVQAFERALYLVPEAPLVRFQLAGLLRDVGRRVKARREFDHLAAWLEQLPPEETIGEFSAALLGRVCREQANRLK